MYMSVAGASRREMDWVLKRCETYRQSVSELEATITTDHAVQLSSLPADCTSLDITRLLKGTSFCLALILPRL